jgi:hypothetical protein
MRRRTLLVVLAGLASRTVTGFHALVFGLAAARIS